MSKINNLAQSYISPFLKKGGFKKKKFSWNRNRTSFVDVIDLQESKGSTLDSERFTLNIGVFVPEFYEAVWGEAHKGFAQEADCVVRFRLGALLQDDFSGQALDTWWDLDTYEDIEKTGLELQFSIQSKVLPFLDSISDFNCLHEFVCKMVGWQQRYPLMQIYFALLKNALDEKEAAVAILNQLASGKNKAWAVRAKQALSVL